MEVKRMENTYNSVKWIKMGVTISTVWVYYVIKTAEHTNARWVKVELELNSKEPIYMQIKKFMKMRIVSGELIGGARLLSVRDYASELKVNPNTILRVYAELENEGLINTQRGIGKFVTEDAENIKQLRKQASIDMLKEFISESKVLGFSKEEIVELIMEMYEEV